jgi:hypothetical protein
LLLLRLTLLLPRRPSCAAPPPLALRRSLLLQEPAGANVHRELGLLVTKFTVTLALPGSSSHPDHDSCIEDKRS